LAPEEQGLLDQHFNLAVTQYLVASHL